MVSCSPFLGKVAPGYGRGMRAWVEQRGGQAAGRGARRAGAAASFGLLALLAAASSAPPAAAQQAPPPGPGVRNQANAVLGLMGFLTIPDGTVSSLSIDSGTGEDKSLRMGQLWLGGTVSPGFPLYVEGMIGYARYDPRFVVSGGAEQREVPARWNAVSAMVGLGWDFPLTPTLVLRPIASLAVGYVASDLRIARAVIAQQTGRDIDFLDGGSLLSGGYGGALMLDYALARPGYEVDVELRYSQMRLEAIDSGSSRGVLGASDAASATLWARLRWPSGAELGGRTLRWVAELTHSEFLGPQRGALGFEALTKIGGGIELDVGKDGIGPSFFELQRVRLMGRFLFGPDVQGFSVGLGLGF